MKNAKQEAKKLFDGLSREELKEMLIDAGFEVMDGTGKVIFTDDEPLKTDLEYVKDMGGEDTSELIKDFRHGRAGDEVMEILKEVPNMIKDIENLQRKIRELKAE